MTSTGIGFGIDFGTTNSVAAIADQSTGRSRPFTDDEGRPHPSVVWYHGDDVTVGREAKEQINRYSEEGLHYFATSVKRHLGYEKSFNIFGKERSAAEIASEVFRHLKTHARLSRNEEIKEAVVAVPVYFDGRQRRELRQAADEAGVFITTFVHEPFAAIAGYLFGQEPEISLEQLDRSKILVFDWGGGTLDITVVSVKSGNLTELSTAGLNDRAGDKFDESLMNAVQSSFLTRNELNITELTQLKSTKDRFLVECERAKITLSDKKKDNVRVAQAYQTESKLYDIDESVTRAEFETLISQDIQAALHEIDKALHKANLDRSEITHVLLIGGSSNIPALKRALADRFGSRIKTVENAGTIIAEGAAIIAARQIWPVLAETIGINLSDGSNYKIYDAGTPIKSATGYKPVNMFCTDPRDGQARLVITSENNIGITIKDNLVIPVSPDLLKYRNERVEVKFRFDDDLILHVSGKGATKEKNESLELFDIKFGLYTG